MNHNVALTPCRDELSRYIARLETEYRPWYQDASNRQYFFWKACSLIALLAGFGTAIVAAFMKEGQFADSGRLLIIFISTFGGIATALLTQFRFQELENLRESGLIELEDIIAFARGRLASAPDEAACHAAYEEVRAKVNALELSQHRTATEIDRGARKRKP